MRLNFTASLLESPAWFIAGLLLYYLISLIKVHLIWYVQPLTLQQREQNLFRSYPMSVVRTIFSSKRILLPTFRYLFFFRKADFLILDTSENKPVKRVLNILDGFTTFLKPYLLFAFVWAMIKFWIDKKFFYDETAVTLGQLQQMLYSIERIPLLAIVQKYKLLIFLVYGIICVLIPYLYDKDELTKGYKKTFTHVLVYLAILAQISFFGALASNTMTQKASEMISLKADIVKLHNSVYRKVFVEAAFSVLKEDVKAEEEEYAAELERFNGLIKAENGRQDMDSVIRKEMIDNLNVRLVTLTSKVILQNVIAVLQDGYSEPNGTKTHLSDFRNAFKTESRSNLATSPEDAIYMNTEEAWNLQGGNAMEAKLNGAFTANVTNNPGFDDKVKKIIGHFFDFGIDKLSDGLLRGLGLDPSDSKTLKKLTTLLASDQFKTKVVAQATKVLSALKESSKRYWQTTMKNTNPDYVNAREVADLQMENDKFIENEKLLAANKQLVKEIRNKIDALDIIIPENSLIVKAVIADAAENGELIDESGVETYIKERGFALDDNLDLRQAIKQTERDEYKKLYTTYNDAADPVGYNQFLQKGYQQLSGATSNLTLKDMPNITLFVGFCRSGAAICTSCGLPCKFPICLAPGR